MKEIKEMSGKEIIEAWNFENMLVNAGSSVANPERLVELTVLLDRELESLVNHWLDHYTRNGDRHYKDTREDRIREIYWERIIGRVCEDLVGEDYEIDTLVERINNL